MRARNEVDELFADLRSFMVNGGYVSDNEMMFLDQYVRDGETGVAISGLVALSDHDGIAWPDNLARKFADVWGDPEEVAYFTNFQEKLKAKAAQ